MDRWRGLVGRFCTILCVCSALGSVMAHSVPASERLRVLSTFDAYRDETIQHLGRRRAFVGADITSELDWNTPQEWRPAHLAKGARAEKGILLVHGLGDSPWSFHDIGPELARQGFLVRTVLLPGHGTHPNDLLHVTADEWRRIVTEQAEAMQRDVLKLHLGGFSTGANLVVEYAYANMAVAGLLLFSPGFKSVPFDWLAPAVAAVRPWIVRPEDDRSRHNEVRYLVVPTNGFAQYYYTSRSVRKLLTYSPYKKPVLMVIAEHDSVLDTNYLLRAFERSFTHPASRLIWYGKPPRNGSAGRVLSRDDNLPHLRISQFSHMSMLFSSDNSLYGKNGILKLCLNGQGVEATKRCKDGETVWYSDWGYKEKGKIHARLTFNPYFDWQARMIASVLGVSD
ncbi:alpha/beta fold hydrolase [Rhizobium bangladeshense]|nr:alpha/beta fold hydrolase [Rhizobium bangladeshense]MBY3616747.1 alpha/beta fold hydrolase [Rhizobium bangladeshense]